MRESSYYQAILDEGRVESRVEGDHGMLLRLGTHKFGRPPVGVLSRLRSVTDVHTLERLGVALLDADSWDA